MKQLKKNCKVCGRFFKPLTDTQDCCSLTCFKLAKAGQKRVFVKKKPVKAKKTLEPRACVICGKMYQPKVARQKYCSDACKRKTEHAKDRQRKAQARKRYLDKPIAERTKICPICGKAFVAERESKVYCSNECLIKHCRDQREYGVVALEKPYKKHGAKHESHIEEINERARAQGMSYGKLQAQKRLEILHQQMERC